MDEARFKAALEEIVSGVYATGKSPRDIAWRVLRGATPVQMTTTDARGAYELEGARLAATKRDAIVGAMWKAAPMPSQEPGPPLVMGCPHTPQCRGRAKVCAHLPDPAPRCPNVGAGSLMQHDPTMAGTGCEGCDAMHMGLVEKHIGPVLPGAAPSSSLERARELLARAHAILEMTPTLTQLPDEIATFLWGSQSSRKENQ